MLANKQIAVIRGGKSAEREVSVKTGNAIVEALQQKGIDPIVIDPAETSVAKAVAETKIDVVFVSVHGKFGAAGTLQGLLELEAIPYTGSGVLGSALAMDKELSKQVFLQQGIPTPEFLCYTEEKFTNNFDEIKQKITNKLGFPVVIKPAHNGSSLGLTKVDTAAELAPAFATGFQYKDKMLVEKYISGREISVGILGNEQPQPLPIVEVHPENEIYDYEAKYSAGMSEYNIPAPLEEKLYQKAEGMAVKAHQALRCQGLSRVDMFLSDAGQLSVLEINTVPGMTKTSLIPKAASAAGMEFSDLVVKVLELALEASES